MGREYSYFSWAPHPYREPSSSPKSSRDPLTTTTTKKMSFSFCFLPSNPRIKNPGFFLPPFHSNGIVAVPFSSPGCGRLLHCIFIMTSSLWGFLLPSCHCNLTPNSNSVFPFFFFKFQKMWEMSLCLGQPNFVGFAQVSWGSEEYMQNQIIKVKSKFPAQTDREGAPWHVNLLCRDLHVWKKNYLASPSFAIQKICCYQYRWVKAIYLRKVTYQWFQWSDRTLGRSIKVRGVLGEKPSGLLQGCEYLHIHQNQQIFLQTENAQEYI